MFRPTPDLPTRAELPLASIGMEALNYSFNDISNFTHNFFIKVSEIISDRRMIPSLVNRTDFIKSYAASKDQLPTTLLSFTVVAPAYIDTNLYAYVQVLEEALTNLSQVDTLMLQPLEKWIAKAISEPDFINKVWITIPDESKLYKSHTEELMKFFNNSAADGVHDQADGVHDQTFKLLYNSTEEYKKCGELVEILVKKAAVVLSSNLSSRATNISKLIYKLTSNNTSNEILRQLPDNKLEQLHQFVLDTAKTLELLAVVLFQIKTVAYAQKCTIEKINLQLKEKK